jgi:hypothetical protein
MKVEEQIALRSLNSPKGKTQSKLIMFCLYDYSESILMLKDANSIAPKIRHGCYKLESKISVQGTEITQKCTNEVSVIRCVLHRQILGA